MHRCIEPIKEVIMKLKFVIALHQWRLLSQRLGGPVGPVQASLASPLLMIAINLALWDLIVLGFVRVI